MSVEREIWVNDIVEDLYAANPHLSLCVNGDQNVLAGKVVHIPQSGASAGASKNRAVLPAKVTKRKDVDVTYALDEFSSDPVLITNAEQCETSYDKRNSVLLDTKNALNETVGVSILALWAPSVAGRMVKTTGEAVDAHLNGATGKRKKITLADFKAAQKQFNKDNVPTEGRYAMLDADMLDQLTDQLSATQERDFSRAYDEKTGVVGKLFGFNILSRSQVVAYTGAGAVKEPSAAGAATDNAAVLCWHTASVECARGETKFFEDVNNPEYYGDIYSALVRMGGRIRRADNKGVLAIVQDTAA